MGCGHHRTGVGNSIKILLVPNLDIATFSSPLISRFFSISEGILNTIPLPLLDNLRYNFRGEPHIFILRAIFIIRCIGESGFILENDHPRKNAYPFLIFITSTMEARTSVTAFASISGRSRIMKPYTSQSTRPVTRTRYIIREISRVPRVFTTLITYGRKAMVVPTAAARPTTVTQLIFFASRWIDTK